MTKPCSIQTTRFWILIVVLLVLGIFFRFANLDYKVYWHDEVYTSIRAAGYTRQEIDQELFKNRIIAAQELQKFQRLKSGSTTIDTINSLALEDPQHPPFYFLIARFWMQIFGSSLTASRSLPALLSLLGLPLMYGLALELFGSRLVATVATALLALSPFDILFAQTARQYSLLTVTVIGSSFLLLRALRSEGLLQTWQNWVLYSLGSAIGLYTHPLFGLTLMAHGVYLLLLSLPFGSPKSETLPLKNWWQQNSQFWQYLLATAGAVLVYSPWLIVISANYQRFSDTTDWTRVSPGWLNLVKLWILSFTSLLLDLDLGFDNSWTYLLRLPVVVLMVVAIYRVCRQASRSTWLFILTSILVPFLMLALPDVLLGGKRSAISRYLIPCFPGVQLAIAYLVVNKLLVGQWLGRGVTVLLLTASIASCTVSAFSDTWWDKDLSYWNAQVARVINTNGMKGTQLNSPLLLSDIGDEFTNTGDLISLSYRLNKNVRLLLLSQPPNLQPFQMYAEPLVFRPSKQLNKAVEGENNYLEAVFEAGRLWRLKRHENRNR